MGNETAYTQIIHDFKEKQQQIVEKIYRKMNGKVITKGNLAEAIHEFLPYYTQDELEEVCSHIQRGIAEGGQQFDFYEKSVGEDGVSAKSYLQYVLNKMPAPKRRTYLYTLYQILCELHHITCDDKDTSALELLSDEELFKRSEKLLEAESSIQGQHIMEELLEGLNKEAPDHYAQTCGFGEEENSWIMAVSVYVASKQNTAAEAREICTEADYAEARDIGRQIGFFNHCKGILKKAFTGYIVPAAITISSFVASIGIIHLCSVGFDAAFGTLMAGTGIHLALGTIAAVAVGYLLMSIAALSFSIPLFTVAHAIDMHYNAVNPEIKEELENELVQLQGVSSISSGAVEKTDEVVHGDDSLVSAFNPLESDANSPVYV